MSSGEKEYEDESVWDLPDPDEFEFFCSLEDQPDWNLDNEIALLGDDAPPEESDVIDFDWLAVSLLRETIPKKDQPSRNEDLLNMAFRGYGARGHCPILPNTKTSLESRVPHKSTHRMKRRPTGLKYKKRQDKTRVTNGQKGVNKTSRPFEVSQKLER